VTSRSARARSAAGIPDRPDLVLIITDQQRFDQVGYESAGLFETPHIDGLAAKGVCFDRAYSGSTTCIPARNSLLTGLQHHQVPKQANGLNLREGFWTVAHVLRSAGYQTAFIGKMHASPMRAGHGFEIVRLCEDLGYLATAAGMDNDDADDYREWLLARGVEDWRDASPGEWFRRVGRWFPYDAELHPTAWIEREAKLVLGQRDPTRPLLLVVSFPQPHAPVNPPEVYLSRYDEADTALPADGDEVNARLPECFAEAMRIGDGQSRAWHVKGNEVQARGMLTRVRAVVAQIDDAVGGILELVDITRSVIFFTSDHGDYGGHRGLLQKNPGIPFDDLARVPLVVAGFDVVGGRRVSSLVQSCDFSLTCFDYAAVAVPLHEFDTCSLRPLLDKRWSAVTNADRTVMCSAFGWPMLRRGPMKYVLHRKSGTAVLFDLDRDPGETMSLLEERASQSVGKELAQELQLRLSRRPPELRLFPTSEYDLSDRQERWPT
jgi:choline-sulfatase